MKDFILGLKGNIVFNVDEIAHILMDTEDIQKSNESKYTKEQAKISAYNKIMELMKGE